MVWYYKYEDSALKMQRTHSSETANQPIKIYHHIKLEMQVSTTQHASFKILLGGSSTEQLC
jgi:hypothetical protein